MLKLVWIPKRYKNFSFAEAVLESEKLLEEIKEQQIRNQKTYADILILQNKIANLTEEEARKNLEILIPFIEMNFPDLATE